jgi:hypothetical protein
MSLPYSLSLQSAKTRKWSGGHALNRGGGGGVHCYDSTTPRVLLHLAMLALRLPPQSFTLHMCSSILAGLAARNAHCVGICIR